MCCDHEQLMMSSDNCLGVCTGARRQLYSQHIEQHGHCAEHVDSHQDV
jgi:hypothetical protein